MRKGKKSFEMRTGRVLAIALCVIMFIQGFCKTDVAKAFDYTTYRCRSAIEFIDVASRSYNGSPLTAKGDATLIATKNANGQVVYTLVDCGTAESANYLLHRLRVNNVTTINNLILTHNHKDHVGGLESLLNSNIKIKRIYMNARGQKSVRNIINRYRSNVPVYSYGQTRQAVTIPTNSNDERITLYTSNASLNADLNESSLVVRLDGYETWGDGSLHEFSCMLLGDLRFEGIQNFVNTYNLDKRYFSIVKVGHHGLRKNFSDDDIRGEAAFYASYFYSWNYIFTANEWIFNPSQLNLFRDSLPNCKYLHNGTSIRFGNWECMS